MKQNGLSRGGSNSITFIKLLIVVFIAMSGEASAQFRRIEGVVIDARTKAPLPYASVGLRHRNIGTVTNELGKFEFNVPEERKEDTLFVSYVGYASFERRVVELEQEASIALTESPRVLEEVTVYADGQPARAFMQEVLKSIPDNYPVNSYLMKGFHRSWEKIEFTDSITYPGTLIEAAISVVDPGYDQHKGKKVEEDIYLEEVRRSSLKEGWNYGGNWLNKILHENVVRYPAFPTFIHFKSFLDFSGDSDYVWGGSTTIDGEAVAIINVTVPSDWGVPARYKVFVSEKDHAILRYEFHAGRPEVDYSRTWNLVDCDYVYSFNRVGDRVFLQLARIRYQIRNVDTVQQRVVRTEDYFMEWLVNEVVTGPFQVDPSHRARRSSFALQAGAYNEEFWKHYNMIKEDPLTEEVSKYFQEQESLEQQYGKAGEKKKK